MRKLFEFLRRIYVVVLFVLLEAVAINYYAHSTCYTQARLLARSTQLAGGVHGFFAGIRHYFTLGRENRELLNRVSSLEERLALYEEAETAARLDSYVADISMSKYRVVGGMVVCNTINRAQNLLTINRGRKDGVKEDMAVLAPDGSMVGYIIDCTQRYSVALSVLNTSFRASGKLVGVDYFGSIYWDGVDPHVVVLDELSKYAEPQQGQEVVTTSFSQYFPENLPIGRIESAELNETRTAYKIRVRLSAEMSRLTNVLLVENRDLNEVTELGKSEKVQQHTRLQ